MIPAQLAQRLCTAFLRVRNPSEVPNDQQQLILDAINGGLADYFAHCPAHLREFSVGARFNGGYSQSVTMTAGTRTFTTATAIADGATILIPGDAVYNRTWLDRGTQTLAVPFGGSSGTVTATIYRDVYVLPSSIEGFVTPPHDPATGIEYVEVLAGAVSRGIAAPTSGYRIERAGASHILRMLPLPTGDTPVMATAVLNAPVYTELASLTDLSTTAPTSQAIPVGEGDCTTLLVPLSAWHLIGHPLWRDADMLGVVQSKYEKAITDLNNLRPRMGAGVPMILAPCP